MSIDIFQPFKQVPCDRFIPYRPEVNIDRAHHAILSPASSVNAAVPRHPPVTPDQPGSNPYKDLLENEFGVATKSRIFSFTPKSVRAKSRRERCSRSTPIRNPRGSLINWKIQAVLDLPGLEDDFYTNTLDWSSKNVVVVALARLVALWNFAGSDVVNINIDFHSPSPVVTSLAWDQPGEQLAIGSSVGEIVLIDHKELKTKCSYSMLDQSRIGVVTWGHNNFFSGSKSGEVCMHDPRSPLNAHARFKHRNYEVCGLQVSPDNRLLACGSDHGELLIWDIGERKIFQRIDAHKAGNRALAWVPFKRRTLVSGGGAKDGHLKIWNVNDKQLLFEHNTECQVLSAAWSSKHEILMTSHGVPNAEGNDVLIWKWKQSSPVIEYVTSMKGHRARPLHMAVGPDEKTVVTAGADETLRVWEISVPTKRKETLQKRSLLHQTIR